MTYLVCWIIIKISQSFNCFFISTFRVESVKDLKKKKKIRKCALPLWLAAYSLGFVDIFWPQLFMTLSLSDKMFLSLMLVFGEQSSLLLFSFSFLFWIMLKYYKLSEYWHITQWVKQLTGLTFSSLICKSLLQMYGIKLGSALWKNCIQPPTPINAVCCTCNINNANSFWEQSVFLNFFKWTIIRNCAPELTFLFLLLLFTFCYKTWAVKIYWYLFNLLKGIKNKLSVVVPTVHKMLIPVLSHFVQLFLTTKNLNWCLQLPIPPSKN